MHGQDDRAMDAARFTSRRRFLLDAGLATGAALCLPGCATTAAPAEQSGHTPIPRQRAFSDLEVLDELNGGADPIPIPWLDANGSHNQSPGPGQEPSNIYHFRGRVARANAFTGMGTDNRGRRIAFGAKSTDFSFMQGEYFAGRQARQGGFSHI